MKKIDEKKLEAFLTKKTEDVRNNLAKTSSDFRLGFELGTSFAALLSSMQAYIIIKDKPDKTKQDNDMIEFFEKLQTQFFNEVININDFLIES